MVEEITILGSDRQVRSELIARSAILAMRSDNPQYVLIENKVGSLALLEVPPIRYVVPNVKHSTLERRSRRLDDLIVREATKNLLSQIKSNGMTRNQDKKGCYFGIKNGKEIFELSLRVFSEDMSWYTISSAHYRRIGEEEFENNALDILRITSDCKFYFGGANVLKDIDMFYPLHSALTSKETINVEELKGRQTFSSWYEISGLDPKESPTLDSKDFTAE